MGRVVTAFLATFCVAVFVASVVVHILSLIPGTVLPFDLAILLHVGALLALFGVMFHASVMRKRALRARFTPQAIAKANKPQLPRLLTTFGMAVFVYVLVNFSYFFITNDGSARIRDGKFVLMHKSVERRELSEAEYHEHQRQELRGISGHWVLFSGFAVGYCLFVVPRVRARLENVSTP